MRFGCSLPMRTFMPEVARLQPDFVDDAFHIIQYRYDHAMQIGYAYIEASVAVLWGFTDQQMQYLADKTKDGSFRLEYCNCFVPARIPLCSAPQKEIEEYVRQTMQKLDLLKVRRVVFGSGGARRRPDDMEESAAKDRIFDFLRLCNKIGDAYGIMTLIEPLNSKETNIINSVAVGAQWVRELDLPNVRLLGDLFHMAMENEDPSVLIDNADIIPHLHVAEAPDRTYPGKNATEYLRRSGQLLRAAGLDKEVSVECGFTDFDPEAAAALAFLREYF